MGLPRRRGRRRRSAASSPRPASAGPPDRDTDYRMRELAHIDPDGNLCCSARRCRSDPARHEAAAEAAGRAAPHRSPRATVPPLSCCAPSSGAKPGAGRASWPRPEPGHRRWINACTPLHHLRRRPRAPAERRRHGERPCRSRSRRRTPMPWHLAPRDRPALGGQQRRRRADRRPARRRRRHRAPRIIHRRRPARSSPHSATPSGTPCVGSTARRQDRAVARGRPRAWRRLVTSLVGRRPAT